MHRLVGRKNCIKAGQTVWRCVAQRGCSLLERAAWTYCTWMPWVVWAVCSSAGSIWRVKVEVKARIRPADETNSTVPELFLYSGNPKTELSASVLQRLVVNWIIQSCFIHAPYLMTFSLFFKRQEYFLCSDLSLPELNKNVHLEKCTFRGLELK